jgi:hypothetical protein
MIQKFVVISLISLSSIFTIEGYARVEVGRVATHQLRISEPSTRSQLISVPFLREPISRGRLDGVDVGSSTFQDAEGAFSGIDDQFTYILRVTGGSAVGAWFLIDASTVDGGAVQVLNDGFAGSLSDLAGDESFAVHALYSLNEIFPEDGLFLPASDLDLKAMQVHFYDGREFKKLWLSNGTITDHIGWTSAEEGALVYAGETAILPGTSFLVLDPRADATVDIRIQGIVLDSPLNIPVYPGYNFVSSNYNKRLAGDDAFLLGKLGLKESGFKSSASLGAGDKVFAYDAQTGQFGESFYLDATTGEFNAPSDFQPGDGFIVFNSGEAYLWSTDK